MFESYGAIFDRRGEQYHRAMMEQPRARQAEFARLVELAQPQAGQLLADLPAGGGYLRPFLPRAVRLLSVETSRAFLQSHRPRRGDEQLLCEELSRIPLPAASVDTAVSLAGAHHLADQPAFYREVWRLLKPGGRFVLADVHAESRVARFLNEWVHAHNPLGHEGEFLTEATPEQMSRCGFAIERAGRQAYAWEFASAPDMVRYCRGLFGLDLATDAGILEALESILGVERHGEGCRLDWELLFVSGVKKAEARPLARVHARHS